MGISQKHDLDAPIRFENLDDEQFDLEVSAPVPIVQGSTKRSQNPKNPIEITAPRAKVLATAEHLDLSHELRYAGSGDAATRPPGDETPPRWTMTKALMMRDQRREACKNELDSAEPSSAFFDTEAHEQSLREFKSRHGEAAQKSDMDPIPAMHVAMRDRISKLGQQTSHFTSQTARTTSRTVRLGQSRLAQLRAFLNDNAVATSIGRAMHGCFYLTLGVLAGLLVISRFPDFSSASATFQSLARFVGVYATIFLVTQVVLLANAPWVVRAFGRARIRVWHHNTAVISVALIGAHGVFALTSSMLEPHANATTAITHVMSGALIPMAIAGFVMLAISSAFQRRLLHIDTQSKYHYMLAIWTAVGAALTFGHQLNSNDFRGNTAAEITMWIAYCGALMIFGYFRLWVPVRNLTRHQLRVEHVSTSTTATSVYLTGSRLEQLHRQEDRELEWRFFSKGNWKNVHAGIVVPTREPHIVRVVLSEASASTLLREELQLGTMTTFRVPLVDPHEDDVVRIDLTHTEENNAYVELNVGIGCDDQSPNATSRSEQRLVYATPGANALKDLPAERRIQRARAKTNGLLFLCTGSGVYRIAKLLQSMPSGTKNICVLYRVEHAADATHIPALEQLAKKHDAKLQLVVGSAHNYPASQQPLSAHHLSTIDPLIADREIFVCADSETITRVTASLGQLGHLPRHLHCAVA